ncbi:MAG TPA: SEC-C domain-containing protein, partial [Nitrospiraceae bacterium]|jgi:hypothetical protein
MSLAPRILAKVDGRLRTELRKNDTGLTTRVPISREQWAVWKRYCDMIGVSVGGGVAVLIDHELGSIVDEEVETLTESVKARESAVDAREKKLADREAAVTKQERFCEFQERQLESTRRRLLERERELDSRQEALEVFASAPQPRIPAKAKPRPGRNQACWCNSGKKYKNCHLDWDQTIDG